MEELFGDVLRFQRIIESLTQKIQTRMTKTSMMVSNMLQISFGVEKLNCISTTCQRQADNTTQQHQILQENNNSGIERKLHEHSHTPPSK